MKPSEMKYEVMYRTALRHLPVIVDQVWRLTRLLLLVPATSATTKRGFSRQLRTYLRATMGQQRLDIKCWCCTTVRSEPWQAEPEGQESICSASDQPSDYFGNYIMG